MIKPQIQKVVPQNQTALDILTSAQGGTCALTKTECCIYIPNCSKNVSEAMKDLNKHIIAVDALTLDPFGSQLLDFLSFFFLVVV